MKEWIEKLKNVDYESIVGVIVLCSILGWLCWRAWWIGVSVILMILYFVVGVVVDKEGGMG